MLVGFKSNRGPSVWKTARFYIYFREPFHPYLAIQQQPHAKKKTRSLTR